VSRDQAETGQDAGGSPGPERVERALASLTAEQRLSVDSPAAALCIVAGAGSGKTRVLTLRATRRIADGSAEADHTAIFTFTRRAAHELRQRLRDYGVPVSSPTGEGIPTRGVRAGTLHQLALALIRRHALDGGRPPPVVAERRFRMMCDIVGDPALASAVDTEVGWAKANCLTASSYRQVAEAAGRPALVSVDQVVDGFAAYEAALQRRRMVDLDDLLIRAGDLLQADAAFAERIRWRYRHLSVDEFQDVNPAQFRLIRALMGDHPDLCVVGDPNQAIYGWNGADPQLIHRLPELVDGLEILRLDANHRSTPQVVAAARAALGPATAGVPRSATPDGPLPVVTHYDDEQAEAEGVVARLLERSGEGLLWSDQAVLARTHDQLAVVRGALGRAGIPHRTAPDRETAVDADQESPARPAARAKKKPPFGSPAGAPGSGDAVELATFHRAKGLEWISVNVIGLEEGYVPIVYAQSDQAQAEERRLLYVAMTRASADLHCSWARVRTMGTGRQLERQPSPWLAAVARVARTDTGRATAADTGRRFAQLRTRLS
jgi:DNA helicase-2/ATP-dependent DNA helicase PcrA